MTEPTRTSAAWESVLGFFVANKLVAFLLVLMLVGAGVMVAPFDWDTGKWPRSPVPVDAIPDIGENQQIVFTEWPGRSPKDVEDQITYPLTSTLLGIAGVKTVRSVSMLGFSSVYVIFDDDVDFYWSRSRILEKLSSLPRDLLPDGVTPSLGPDATALGQVFWYTLEGRDGDGRVVGGWDLHELRGVQDWTVRYALQSVPGVSEVASIGGHVQEYQIDVDPDAMRAHGVMLMQIAGAVRASNLDVGARTLEVNRTEYVVRGLGFVRDREDLEDTVVAERNNVPIRVRDVARVSIGPAYRSGALDNGGAEAVGGVVVVRFGENPLEVIKRVKAKVSEIAPGLPRRALADGTVSQVTVVPFYDRTTLIHETLDTLSSALVQQILITIIVVIVMMRHLASSIVISLVLPLAVLASFLAMKAAGVDANIMSLAGIAIAIGTMVDMGIVLVENVVARLQAAPPGADRVAVIRHASAEVGPAVLTAVATTVASFLPVFALSDAEGKLFAPLAFTKTMALAASLGVSLLILPMLVDLIVSDARPAAPHGRGWRRALRSIARREHARDWILMAMGAVLAFYALWAGLVVVALGATHLVAPLLPARWHRLPGWLENGAAIIAVVAWLTTDWMPLGLDRSVFANLVFVVDVLVIVLGGFHLFASFYRPILGWCLEYKAAFLALPAFIVVFGVTAWLGFDRVFGWLPASIRHTEPLVKVAHALPGFGREFMPPFDEGSYLYMPTTMPHASIGQALEMLRQMDAAIASIPEVEDVVGKLGRVESALDPAPVSMFEVVVTYKPEYLVGEDGKRVRQWRDHIRTPDDVWREIVAQAELPGVTSAPKLMPIAARIVMLQSGMRAPLGVKVRGPDLDSIQKVGVAIEGLLKQLPSIRPETVFADRIVGKPYLEIDIDRAAIGRFGLSVEAVQDVIRVAVGGEALTRTVEGRERYPVRVRYMREERDSVEALRRVLVPTSGGAQVPLEQLARIEYVRGPEMIRSEDTFLTSYVLFDKQQEVAEVDVVEQARAFLQGKIASGELELPAGTSFAFAGSYENQVRSEKSLRILVPLALGIIFITLYLHFRQTIISVLIYTGVAVAISGGFILMWAYNQPGFLDFSVFGVHLRSLFHVMPVNLSTAVWVGFIALVGVATDDGVVMATYIRQELEQRKPTTAAEIREAVLTAGLRRIRPCLMTIATTILALLPVFTSQGRGSDIMVPMAIPSLGGITIEFISVLIVPVLYCLKEEIALAMVRRRADRPAAVEASDVI